jgi:RNA polymerase sigma-70 factor (ECF subfamily)
MTRPPPANPLLSALAAGQPDAFAKLYEALGGRLLRTAITMCGSRDDAEDAIQELFVTLAHNRRHFERVIDLEAYVFASLRYGLLARIRRHQREKKHLVQLAEMQRSHNSAGRVPDDQLAEALQSLPPDQREVIALKIDADLTFAQAAEVLGVSINTVASRYRYALEKLRRRLEQK